MFTDEYQKTLHAGSMSCRKILSALLCLSVLFLSACGSRAQNTAEPSRYEYVFVHGLSGWGSYDEAYKTIPYWGMLGGDLMKYLNREGYSSYAASVAPDGSAWDRACELYAQLAGTVVDYGKAHSEKCGHERFGRDFSQDPLIPNWSDGRKIVLLGHSFGGATIRLFSELLANGSQEEREATAEEDLSALFEGGQGERIHALVTLAAPTNGTTAYDMHDDESFDLEAVEVSGWDMMMGKLFNSRKKSEPDGRASEDYAAYDMHIDNALALNERIETLPGTYYFAVPCSASRPDENGNHQPIRSIMEGMFRKSSTQMGSYSGRTRGGIEIDASWKENDGLVNTVSAMAPMNAPSTEFDKNDLKPGIWNVMPPYIGDHMSLQGGMMKRNNVRPFYSELLGIIENLPET